MRPGDVIGDRYEIQREAGAGGMSVVYCARDRVSDQLVALKILSGRDESAAGRFLREGQLLGGLRHPGIVRYVDHGVTPRGERFLAMEWLSGEELSTRLARVGCNVNETLALGRVVAEALGYAHAQGLVHRDIKPSNLFVVDGRIEKVKILDFGIARAIGQAALTFTGTRIGTPAYMSPEQARGVSQLDARSDVYSLGVVLFLALAGRLPYSADDPMALIAKVLLEDAPRLRDILPSCPPELDALVADMLQKAPQDRPSDGAVVAARMAQISSVTGDERIAPVAGLRALTVNEQHLISLLLVQDALNTGDDTALKKSIEPFGARLERMANGSALVTISGSEAATDLSVRGARCALRLRTLLPLSPMALCTGRGILTGDSSTVGEVIDRAAHLLRQEMSTQVLRSDEQPAQPRRQLGVRVDDVTASLLEARFVIDGDESGRELIAERDEMAARPLLGRPTPCVGREAELGSLEALARGCFEDFTAKVALLTAPAGYGKSRLRQELLGRLRAHGAPLAVFFGAAEVTSAGSPLAILGSAIRRAADLRDSDPLPTKRAQLQARVAQRVAPVDVERVTQFLGEMISVPFSDEASVQLRAARNDALLLGDQMRRALEDFFRAEVQSNPVVLVLEDLHWSDPSSVATVDAIMRALRDLPFFVLATARPEVHQRFPRLWAERGLSEVRLAALSKRGAERLVRHVLGRDVAVERLDQIVERAQGNAFFLEELIRNAAEQRSDMPETLVAMLQTRLESLEPEARLILRAAAVFGEVFWQTGVAHLLAGALSDDRLRFWIEFLVERELVAARPHSRFRDEIELGFRHALVREAAYSMLTSADRELGHRLAAAWLEERGERDPVRLAEHYHLGGDAERSVLRYREAAEQSLAANDLDAVLRCAERALQSGAADEERGALRALEAEAYVWRGQFHEAERAADEAVRLLPAGSDGWCTAVAELGQALGVQGARERLAGLATQMVGWTAPLRGRAVAAMTRLSEQLIIVGEMALADTLLSGLVPVERELADVDPAALGRLLTVRALRERFAGHAERNLELVAAAVDAFERAGDRRNWCMRRERLGYAHLELGDAAEAVTILRAALATADELGLRNLCATAKHNLGLALSRSGEHAEAERIEADAAESFATLGNRRMAGASWEYLALVRLAAGRTAEAHHAAERALAIAVEPPVLPLNRAESRAILAETLLAAGRAAEAHTEAATALAELEALGGIDDGEAIIRLAYAKALAQLGDREGARRAITAAHERLVRRADRFTDPRRREQFLTRVPENAETIALVAELERAER